MPRRVYENVNARNAAARERQRSDRNRELQKIRDLRRAERNALERARRNRVALERPAIAPSAVDAITLYHVEKAASLLRNAEKRADEKARLRAAIQKADDDATAWRKGGRPALKSPRANPADALCLAVGEFRGTR